MKFKLVKKGYEIAEVDEYVFEAEHALAAQKERITALKKKIAMLEKELETYYERKDLILTALSEAVKKAEEIERRANQKYDLEIQRLRQFHYKWTEYYIKLIKQHPIVLGNTDEFNREMDRILKETECVDLNIGARRQGEVDSLYKKERERLTSDQAAPKSDEENLTPLERIKNYLENMSYENGSDQQAENALPSEEGVFSLEEALHPKQDLVDIMKDLGLIFED